MQPPDTRLVSTLAIVGAFSGLFIFLNVLLVILVIFIPSDSPFLVFLVGLATAMGTATYWFSREKAVPASGRAWKVALICGGISGVLSSALTVFGLSSDERSWNGFFSAGIPVIIAVFAAIVVIQVLVARLGFWFTFRQAAKKAA